MATDVNPEPVRIVSDVVQHSSQPPPSVHQKEQVQTQQHPGKGVRSRMSSGLAGSSRIVALQEEWEKKQANMPGPAPGRESSSDSSPSSDEDDDGDELRLEQLNGGVIVPFQPSLTTKPSLSHTPVPIPDYPASKRPSTGAQESPRDAKRRQIEQRIAADRPRMRSNGNPRTAVPVPMSGTNRQPELPRSTSENQVSVNQHSSNSNAQSSGGLFRVWRGQTEPSWPRNEPQSVSPLVDVQHVDFKGEKRAVIKYDPTGRPYSCYSINGLMNSACGALIPDHYQGPSSEWEPFICPIRDCRKMLDNLRALGGHFSAAHGCLALNDNGDGTFSRLGKYKKALNMRSKAYVISQDSISADAPPPVEPSMSFANKIRSRASLPEATSTAMVSRSATAASPAALNSGSPSGMSDAVAHLHTFLSTKQSMPSREDIEFMTKLPLRRNLPDKWLEQHQGDVIDTDSYACALAYIVGEEDTSNRKCSFNTPLGVIDPTSTWRLSDRCIRVPAGMPFSAREKFSKVLSCVGCRYWSHFNDAPNGCDWNPRRKEEKVEYGERLAAEDYVEDADMELPDDIPEPHPRGELRRRKIPVAYTIPAYEDTPIIDVGQTGGESIDMEDWEFAPGRQLDAQRKETIAFSTSYVTGPQPITISDDISFHRLRLAPGGTEHFPTDHDKIRYCEVISGKVQLKYGGQSFAIGQGGLFVIRPGMMCTVENRQYGEAVLSCHSNANYSLIG